MIERGRTGFRVWRVLLVVVASLLTFLPGPGGYASAQPASPLIIGTGGVAGNYFPVGGVLCRLFNAHERQAPPRRCVVLPTGGSIENLNALRAGAIDFAIVQSDWQYQAFQGSDVLSEDTPFTELRSVLSLYAEPLVLLAEREGGLRAFEDLQGRRIGIGAPGSQTRAVIEDLVAALGWSMGDFDSTMEQSPVAQIDALCGGQVDAAGVTAGSPSALLVQMLQRCDIAPLAIAGASADAVLAAKPYYRRATVPAGLYAGIEAAVPTIGIGATLVTRADVPAEIVERLVGAVVENFEQFRISYPVLARLLADEMPTAGLTAPLHPAAAQIFAARGWAQ